MAQRAVSLGQQVNGINLMRQKGGASEKALIDLVNGYVTADGTIKARPGSVLHDTLPANTKGLLGYDGKLHTFHHTTAAETATHKAWVLRHPTGGAATLRKIHRAFVFLGRIYVVAEFTDNVVQHYWLENPPAWDPTGSPLFLGSMHQPTTPNGYYYEVTGPAGGGALPAAWRPNTRYILGSAVQNEKTVQPTTPNNRKYTITNGTAPVAANTYMSGNTEPEWPTTVGATVTERRYVTEPQTQPEDEVVPTPPTAPPPTNYAPYPPIRDSDIGDTQEN